MVETGFSSPSGLLPTLAASSKEVSGILCRQRGKLELATKSELLSMETRFKIQSIVTYSFGEQ